MIKLRADGNLAVWLGRWFALSPVVSVLLYVAVSLCGFMAMSADSGVVVLVGWFIVIAPGALIVGMILAAAYRAARHIFSR